MINSNVLPDFFFANWYPFCFICDLTTVFLVHYKERNSIFIIYFIGKKAYSENQF
jgi:hypothetical protein